MNYNRRFNGSAACAKVVREVGLYLFAAALFLVNPYVASADHSLGNTCNTCHSLRAQTVLSTTSNLINFSGSPASTDLYTSRWYCDGTDTYDPLGANSWSPGQPPHCTLCHDSGNILIEFDPSTQSLHPVFTDGPTWAQFTTKFGATPHRIYCQDCHNSELLPADITDTENLCESGGDGGHPNHQNMSAVAQATGTNNRVFDETHLDLKYGDVTHGHASAATYGVDWTAALTGGNEPLCFKCHKSPSDIHTGYGMADIASLYNAADPASGGHNNVNFGSLVAKQLPCYDCHDPHGSANARLIISDQSGNPNNPFGSSYTNVSPVAGYDGTNDRDLCLSCHGGSAIVEGITLPNVLAGSGLWTPTMYSWHKDAHETVLVGPYPASNPNGNCLSVNSGCHQEVHDNDLSDCNYCHDSATPPPAGMGHVADRGGPTACDDCHGFPPVDDSETPVTRTNAPHELVEDYTYNVGANGGGGVHRSHVNLFWTKLTPGWDPTLDGDSHPTGYPSASYQTMLDDAVALCGPCHGDNPGVASWHNENNGLVLQENVDIRTRVDVKAGGINLGFNWGDGTPEYVGEGGQIDMSLTDGSGGKAQIDGPQVCSGLECHGNPVNSGSDPRGHYPETLSWQDTIDVTTDGTGGYQVSKKTAICKWCHDETKAWIILRDVNGDRWYDSENSDGDASDDPLPSGVTASYFAPPNGNGKGGHGDGDITAAQDPTFVDSAPSAYATGNGGKDAVPLDCIECHDDSSVAYDGSGDGWSEPGMKHFPASAETPVGVHRLTITTIEDGDHDYATGNTLCGKCHDGDFYPGWKVNDRATLKHHPSYIKWDGSRVNLVPVAGQQVYNAPPAPGGYSASGDPENIDFNVVFASEDVTGLTPVLPLSQYVLAGSPDTDVVMCVTCHNPHGTALYVDTSQGSGEDIPNKMLRLRDSDNTLCDGCH